MLSPTPANSLTTTESVDEALASASGVSENLQAPVPTTEVRRVNSWRLPPAPSVAMFTVSLVLVWSYASNISFLIGVWNRDPNYSHGFLVVPVSLVILWRRW